MTLFFVDAITKTTILLAGAAFITTWLRRSSAASRHLVWTVALAAALVLPLLSLAVPRWQVPVIAIDSASATETTPPDAAASSAMAARLFDRMVSTTASDTVAGAPADDARILGQAASWPLIALAIWLSGAAAILGRLLLGLVAVHVLARRSPSATAAAWLPLARDLAARLGVAGVSFRRGRHASMPMAWGLIRGTVTLPEDADAWPDERLRIVLLHELAHVKRRDCLTHVLVQAACACYWFNPLVWIAARRVRAERERACDDLVLAAGTPGPDYADQLLDIARVMRAGRFPAVLAGATLAMAHRSQLEGRLMAILDPSVSRAGVSRVRGVTAAAVAAIALVPLASLQAWATAERVTPPTLEQSVLPTPTPTPMPTPAPTPAPTPNVVVEGPTAPKGGVPGGVVGAVVDGVVGGVVGGITGGISGSLERVVSDVVRDTVPVAVQAADEARAEQDAKKASSKADPKVVAALTAALKDTDKEVRETALQALVRLRDPGVFEPLLQALKDGSPDMREQAAHGLGQMRDKRAVEPLLAAIRDENPNVREQVIFALGQLRDPRAIEAFVSALKDANANVREQAAFGLGQMRASSAVEALIVAVKDGNANVREQVVFALGQIRDPRAIDALTAALKDTSANVRQQAAFALGQLVR
jgi:HEAT repeat protein/beta-lactamase regulating signal transducer with metallopeptidase domain